MKRYVHGLAIVMFLVAPSAAGQCLNYEPDVVAISGELAREVHPGPPNYASVQAGDRAETIWVVTLSEPICVLGSSEPNSAESNVGSIQVFLSAPQFEQYRPLVGSRVRISGTLFHASSGHHYRAVLIHVEDMRSAA